MGDFAHTLLILLATVKLTPALGATKAASIATALYLLHNVFYAVFSMVAGWLADRVNKGVLLAGGYFLAAVMTMGIVLLPMTVWTLAFTFLIGGVYVGMEETLEDSFCAELVPEPQHGMAFGTLATVNGVGDFVSSAVVGLLWTFAGTGVAFAYSGVLFVLGGLLAWRVARPTASAGKATAAGEM
jgi:MFS family permease